jgi:transketolase
MPNMLIASQSESIDSRACIRYLVENLGPSYLRLGKAGEFEFHSTPPDVAPGRWLKLRACSATRALHSTGAGLQIAMDWAANPECAEHAAYSTPLWSMADKVEQGAAILEHDEIVTVEDHLQDGGFGSWMLEACALASGVDCNVRSIALGHEVCETVGSQATLNRVVGILP